MAKFVVRITQTAEYEVVIEAADEDNARALAMKMAGEQDIGQFADMTDGSFEIWDTEEIAG